MLTEIERAILQGADVFSENCPTRKILDLVGDKWSTLIITLLHQSPKRFSQLQRQIEGISQKMLTQNLRSLERAGLVIRTVYAEVPPRVEYTLTPLGETFYLPILAIQQWAVQHFAEVLAAQDIYDQKPSSNSPKNSLKLA